MIYLLIVFIVLIFLFVLRVLYIFRDKKPKRVKIIVTMLLIFTFSLISGFVSPPSDSNKLGYVFMNYDAPSTFVAVYKNAFRGLIGEELEIHNDYKVRDDYNEARRNLREKKYSKYFEYLAIISAQLSPYLILIIITLFFISLFYKGN